MSGALLARGLFLPLPLLTRARARRPPFAPLGAFLLRDGHGEECVADCHDRGEDNEVFNSEFHPYPTADGRGENRYQVVDGYAGRKRGGQFILGVSQRADVNVGCQTRGTDDRIQKKVYAVPPSNRELETPSPRLRSPGRYLENWAKL